MTALEYRIVAFFQNLHGQNLILDRIMIYINAYAAPFFLLLFLTGIGYQLYKRKIDKWRTLFTALLIIGVTMGANSSLRFLVGRERPFALYEELYPLIYHSAAPSFPSNHAAASFAVACAFFLIKPALAWPAAGAAVLVSLSRVYAGVHFPTDVLAGTLIAIAVFKLVMIAVERFSPRLKENMH